MKHSSSLSVVKPNYKVKISVEIFYLDNLIHLMMLRYPLTPSQPSSSMLHNQRNSMKRREKFIFAHRICSTYYSWLIQLRQIVSVRSLIPCKEANPPTLFSDSKVRKMPGSKRQLCSYCVHTLLSRCYT